MFTTAVQSGTDTTFGRTGKKTVLNAGPYGYCVSPSIHHLHSFLHLSHSVYVCIFSKHHSVYVKCKLLCLEKLTCFYFTPHWLRLHTSGTDFQNFMNIILFHTDQDFGKKHCLILWIPFLLFQELLCCSERPFALPAYSANQNIVHSHFTPFPLVSVLLYLHAKCWTSR